jgi:hypothetical protein
MLPEHSRRWGFKDRTLVSMKAVAVAIAIHVEPHDFRHVAFQVSKAGVVD